MQAIITKYLPAGNVRGARIKASCDRGSLTIDYPHECNAGTDAHREAARQLVSKLAREDEKEYGTKPTPDHNRWLRPFITGGLPSGEHAHVFLPWHDVFPKLDQLHANAAESPEWIRTRIEAIQDALEGKTPA